MWDYSKSQLSKLLAHAAQLANSDTTARTRSMADVGASSSFSTGGSAADQGGEANEESGGNTHSVLTMLYSFLFCCLKWVWVFLLPVH